MTTESGRPDGSAFTLVEYAKRTVWLEKTDRARRRWNNDNEPHRETWQINN